MRPRQRRPRLRKSPWTECSSSEPVEPRLSEISSKKLVMIQVVTSDKSSTSLVVLQHATHIQKDCSSHACFPIRIEPRQRDKESQTLKHSLPSTLVIRVPPCRKPILVMFFVHPIQ